MIKTVRVLTLLGASLALLPSTALAAGAHR